MVGPWRAVVFDLDDTLYPERDYVLSGFQAVAAWAEAELGIPSEQGFTELKQLFDLGVRGNTFDHWLEEHSLPADDGLTPQLVRVYRAHEPVLTPFPEAPGVLASLRDNYRLGLVSDGYLAVQRRKLSALGLAPYFDAVVFSDRWGREVWKPSPTPFEAVLDRLAVEAPRSIYVGDNPLKDFLGARRAGMYTVWVRRPGAEYAHLEPPTSHHAPHCTLASLASLAGVLGAGDLNAHITPILHLDL
ncbi:MAG TPA: HAD family hydrolase [Chloroflexi bacterium]|nr:HAD family hydrolase [Chloroflexota bacterium]